MRGWRNASPRSGRSKTWLKTKCFTESELMLVGIDRDRKTGAERALLAKQEANGLVYAGAAFLALGGEAREALTERAKELAQERPILVCTENLNPDVVVMKSAKDRV